MVGPDDLGSCGLEPYVVTGDRAFLALAYQTAVDTLAREKQLHFNVERGLYEGPAF